jgi:GntR family transcriptional regulator
MQPETRTTRVTDISALPLYHKVAAVLRQRIRDGTYVAGERLAPEDDLAAEFEVSRATVRQAMGALVMEGLVSRKQGRGTFVLPAGKSTMNHRFHGSLSDLINESIRAQITNLTVNHDVPVPEPISAALQLERPVGSIVKRTRMMDGQPFAYTINYLPPHIGRQLTETQLQEMSLMQTLLSMGIKLGSATQTIRAELADIDTCTWLGVEVGAAVLFVERLVQNTEGRPVEFVRSWYRGDRYEYTIALDLEFAAEGRFPHLAAEEVAS